MRPSEPFMFQYLTGPLVNLTPDQVNQEIYPIGIYSYLVLLVVIFLITDLLRYKPLIIFSGLSVITVWSLLIWSTNFISVQILEVLYGTFMATEVAYFSYIYAKVPREYYQLVTSHTRAATLAGKAISGFLAQILISFNIVDYKGLHYITLTAVILATISGIFLPSVGQTVYFHKKHQTTTKSKYRSAFILMIQHFQQIYKNLYVMKWSVWWSLTTCAFIQVTTYIQPLWDEISNDQDTSYYNGVVEASLAILGFISALIAGVLKVNFQSHGVLILPLCSIGEGALLVVSSQTESLVVCYICYIAFGVTYYFMITITVAEVAKHIAEDSYGLIFGFNTFVALSLQTIIMLTLVSGSTGYALSPKNQFLVYGIYYFIIAILFIIIGLINWIKTSKNASKM